MRFLPATASESSSRGYCARDDPLCWLIAHGSELSRARRGPVRHRRRFSLSVRENIWSWPTAIVNVSLYFALFFKSGLYSDMGLQAVYFALSLYGWYEALYGDKNRTALKVSHAAATVGHARHDCPGGLGVIRQADLGPSWRLAPLRRCPTTTTSLVAQ